MFNWLKQKHPTKPQARRPRGLRTVPFERKAVIAYRVTKAVEITNIFYGGRDYEALYRSHDDKPRQGKE
jgi:toxin ParE1/3/4